jgi:myo-inositol-1(or 4)-monophosphatase
MGLPCAMFSLSYTIDGVPMVAVTFEPHRKQLFSAVKGEGSYCNDRKLQVSSDDFESGLIALAPDYIRPGLIDEPFMQKLLAYDKQLAIFPGAVYRSCMVASGRIAGFAHPRVKPYDIAAAHLIVEEAGGTVTGVDGQPLDYSTEFKGAVISNDIAHAKLLELFT